MFPSYRFLSKSSAKCPVIGRGAGSSVLTNKALTGPCCNVVLLWPDSSVNTHKEILLQQTDIEPWDYSVWPGFILIHSVITSTERKNWCFLYQTKWYFLVSVNMWVYSMSHHDVIQLRLYCILTSHRTGSQTVSSFMNRFTARVRVTRKSATMSHFLNIWVYYQMFVCMLLFLFILTIQLKLFAALCLFTSS